eukprot:COSAG01_NODE_20291_length_961_cov_1.204176_2_plen_172_part_01
MFSVLQNNDGNCDAGQFCPFGSDIADCGGSCADKTAECDSTVPLVRAFNYTCDTPWGKMPKLQRKVSPESVNNTFRDICCRSCNRTRAEDLEIARKKAAATPDWPKVPKEFDCIFIHGAGRRLKSVNLTSVSAGSNPLAEITVVPGDCPESGNSSWCGSGAKNLTVEEIAAG